jgi:3',5'-cyclic-AMP phosphodiesterase
MSRQHSHRLIHLTDSHLFGNTERVLLGLNTHQSFYRVIVDIATNAQQQGRTPALMIATGDIAQDGSAAAYQAFAQAMSSLTVPWMWTAGNHDDPAVMRKISASRLLDIGQLQLGNWLVLMLDTHVPGHVHGQLSADDLRRLRSSLAGVAGNTGLQHVLLCMHHNPLTANAAWMADIGLRNADELQAVLRDYPVVRAVLHGHIHQDLDQWHEGVRYLCTPSTCVQFKPDADDFELDLTPPAWRWLELDEDGSITTQVQRLHDYEVKVDMNVGGY